MLEWRRDGKNDIVVAPCWAYKVTEYFVVEPWIVDVEDITKSDDTAGVYIDYFYEEIWMNNVVYVDLWNDEEKDPEFLAKI